MIQNENLVTAKSRKGCGNSNVEVLCRQPTCDWCSRKREILEQRKRNQIYVPAFSDESGNKMSEGHTFQVNAEDEPRVEELMTEELEKRQINTGLSVRDFKLWFSGFWTGASEGATREQLNSLGAVVDSIKEPEQT